MTRKQRNQTGRNITYDLSNPRNIAAFEALLQDEEAEEAAATSTSSSRPSKATRQQQARKKRDKEKFFLLKDDAGTATTPPASQEEQVQLLLEMFEGAADRSLVSDVYQASGCSVEAAAEALFGLLGGGDTNAAGPVEPSRPAAAAAAAGGSRSFAAAAAAGGAGASTSSAAASKAAAAAFARQQQQQQQQQPLLGELSVSWGDLPPDVRSTILSQLTPQDLARAASTCGEFRDWANAMRAHVRHLVLQPGVSYSCLKGVVSSHVAAGVMDFTRFERHIAKLDPKELLPQVVAMHKQEAEAALFKGLMAVAEGSTASCRRVPVTGLILRGLVGVTDRLLAEALRNLKGLRSLDVSNCPNITNKSLYLLAKYKATQGLSSQHTQSKQLPSTQQPRTQQQELQEAQGEPEELLYGWASSSREDESDDDDSSSCSSSEGADDTPGGEAEADTTASAPAGESTTDAPDTAAQHHAEQQQQQEEVEQAAGSGVVSGQGSVRPDTSSATTAAASVGRQMAALEIQASLFHRPEAQLLGAADAQAAAEQAQADAAEAPAATAAAEVGGLVELKLAGNRAFLDDGLRQVLQNPAIKHSLAKLDVSNCRSITSAGLVIPPLGVLRELKACRVHGLQQLVLHLPASHPLASLDLSNCHYLQLLDLNLSGLTTLNLSACRTLYRLRMRCPALESLSLAQCGNLFDFHDDAWQVPALQQLNMYGCRRASGPQLQVVLDRLPALQWISLNGCHGITTLHLTRNLELQSVDLSGCRFLSAFSCASPALQQLTAASCSRLGSLTLGSNIMRVLLLPNCKQLATVHASTPSPAEAAAAAAAAAAASSAAGRRDGDQPRSGAEGSSSSRGRGSGRVLLDTKGCVSLPAEGRARLVAAMAGAH